MNRREFYRDVLREGSSADFEETVFRKTFGMARRKRRIQVVSRIALVALVAGYLGFQFLPRQKELLVQIPLPALEAAPAHTVLASQPFMGIIRSAKISPELLVPADSHSLTVLKTSEAGAERVKPINDDQLLALFQGHPVALVGRGTGRSELVFLDRGADQ